MVMNEVLLPIHTSPNCTTMMGGQIMAWMDLCAGMAAKRHCRYLAVTVSMDDLQFRHHAKVCVASHSPCDLSSAEPLSCAH